MNKMLMQETGFEREVALVEQKRCPFCAQPIGPFCDALSEREYHISGLCQKCQDAFFSVEE